MLLLHHDSHYTMSPNDLYLVILLVFLLAEYKIKYLLISLEYPPEEVFTSYLLLCNKSSKLSGLTQPFL